MVLNIEEYPNLNIFFDQKKIRWSRRPEENETIIASFYFSLDDLDEKADDKINEVLETLNKKNVLFSILPIPRCKLSASCRWKIKKRLLKEPPLFFVDGNDFRFVFNEEVEGMKDFFKPHVKCSKCFHKLVKNCQGINYFYDKYKKEKEWLYCNNNLRNKKINFLDLGCGVTSFVDLYQGLVKKNGSTFFCIDPSGAYIENLKTKIKKDFKNNIFARVGAGETMDFPAEYFDGILLFNSYAHLNDVEKTLSNVFYSLKKNGLLIIFESCELNVGLSNLLNKEKIEDNFFDRREYQNHDSKAVKKLLENKKFEIIDIFENRINNIVSWGVMAVKK